MMPGARQPTARNSQPAGAPPSTRPSGAPARPGARSSTGASPALEPISAAEFGHDQARHLLWRAGFGGTPGQIETLAGWGPERAVDHLLDIEQVQGDDDEPDKANLSQFSKDIMRPPTAEDLRARRQAQAARDEDALARYRLRRQEAERADREQMRAIQRWWLTRLIETGRPLEEKMTLFWHGHFATSYRTIEDSYHMLQQNGLFRSHALGNFGGLLYAIIRDPAMLAYLDQNDSRKGKPNENLARELMELFALGVGNYSEKDIKEGARALTGFSFDDDTFVFRPADHDNGNKTILDKRGTLDGDGFVTAILEQRATSRYLTRKLYRWFAADVPDDERETDPAAAEMLAALASTFLKARYEIRPVLRQLFLSRHFYGARLMNQQIKSPAQLVVGAVRSLGTPVRDLSILIDALDLMGQNLFFPPSVKGWDGGRSWINTSTLFVRQNVLAFLLTGKKPQGYDALAGAERYDPMALLGALGGADAGAAADPRRAAALLLRFTLGSAPSHAQDELTGFLTAHKNAITPETVTGLLLLVTAMPEYQLC